MQDEPRPENRSSIKLRTSPSGHMEVEKGRRACYMFYLSFSSLANRCYALLLHDTINRIKNKGKLGLSNFEAPIYSCIFSFEILIYSYKITCFQGDEGCMKAVGCFDFSLYCLFNPTPAGVDGTTRKAEICSHFGFRCKSRPEEFDQTHAVRSLYKLC